MVALWSFFSRISPFVIPFPARAPPSALKRTPGFRTPQCFTVRVAPFARRTILVRARSFRIRKSYNSRLYVRLHVILSFPFANAAQIATSIRLAISHRPHCNHLFIFQVSQRDSLSRVVGNFLYFFRLMFTQIRCNHVRLFTSTTNLTHFV